MATLREHDPKKAFDLARELTLKMLEKVQPVGDGQRWGTDAADAFEACLARINQIEYVTRDGRDV